MAIIAVDTDEILEPIEFAIEIKKSLPTIYRWIKEGRIITITIRGIKYIPKSELARIKEQGD